VIRKPPTVNGKPVLWETCQTFSGSWGYHRDESTWKSVGQLVGMLIDTVSKGGNLLLNVGPTARGTFDGRALDRLEGMGKWMRAHRRSIYGCGPASEGFQTPQDCRLTYNAETRRLYVHVFAWPFGALYLDGMADKVKYAQLLSDGSELAMFDAEQLARRGVPEGTLVPSTPENTLVLSLPVQRPDVAVPVIELFLE
jgi:alpha-L-fucosidase